MKENIETKDVQRTEYLDKNGLDMLWTKVKENTHNQVEVERNRAVAKENSIIDTKADKSALDNYVLTTALAEYAKKTDIPEIDTSDFVSKSDTITQTINSGLIAMDKLQVFSKNYYDQHASLRGGIFVEGADTKFTLNDTTASHNYMELTASKLVMGQDVGDNTLLITTSGIANTDNNANHVYATDGSIADLTQYALSSTIAALQQKITDNTTAISAKQDAGNYIPYNKASDSFYYLYNIGIISQIGDDSNKTILHPAFFEQSDGNHSVTIRDGYINISNTRGNIMTLNNDDEDGGIVIYKHLSNSIEESLRILEDGIRLIGGDNNHVLTSNASTIDITQYAKKSELPTVPTKVSQLQNDSNFAYKEKVDTLVNNLQIDVNRLSTDKQDKIIPGNLNISALNSQNTIVALKNTIMDLISVLEKSGVITVTRS